MKNYHFGGGLFEKKQGGGEVQEGDEGEGEEGRPQKKSKKEVRQGGVILGWGAARAAERGPGRGRLSGGGQVGACAGSVPAVPWRLCSSLPTWGLPCWPHLHPACQHGTSRS